MYHFLTFNIENMKKSILAIAIVLASFSISAPTQASGSKASTTPEAKEKAIKSFHSQFGKVSDLAIFHSKSGFIFKSYAGGKSVSSSFDKKGNWIYSVERFPSNQLLKNIIDRVGMEPGNGFVTGIQKVTQPDSEPVFVIQTQGKDFIKTFRLLNNELESVADYKKE